MTTLFPMLDIAINICAYLRPADVLNVYSLNTTYRNLGHLYSNSGTSTRPTHTHVTYGQYTQSTWELLEWPRLSYRYPWNVSDISMNMSVHRCTYVRIVEDTLVVTIIFRGVCAYMYIFGDRYRYIIIVNCHHNRTIRDAPIYIKDYITVLDHRQYVPCYDIFDDYYKLLNDIEPKKLQENSLARDSIADVVSSFPNDQTIDYYLTSREVVKCVASLNGEFYEGDSLAFRIHMVYSVLC